MGNKLRNRSNPLVVLWQELVAVLRTYRWRFAALCLD